MCTAVKFTDDTGNMYFGRNLDWSEGYGESVVITPRKYNYKSAFLGENDKGLAVIGMAVIAENTPLYFDCANEAGLAIAGLNFPGYAKYEEAPISGKTNLAAYEFPLWVARNFKNVDELIKILPTVKIIAKPINKQYPVSELHWMVGDSKRSITIEYTEDGMNYYDNVIDVLANQPTFDWHKENLRNYLNVFPKGPKEVEWGQVTINAFGAGALTRGLPGDYYSPSRFVRAAYFNTHYPVKTTEIDNVTRLFRTLSGVSMIEGASVMADWVYEKTIYTGGYSSKTQTYYYSTYDDPSIKSVVMGEYNLGLSTLITA